MPEVAPSLQWADVSLQANYSFFAVEFENVHPTNPFDGSSVDGALAAAGSTTCEAPAKTTAYDNSLIVYVAGHGHGSTLTHPAGTTERAEQTMSNVAMTYAFADLVKAIAGTQPASTWSRPSEIQAWRSGVFAIRAADPAGPPPAIVGSVVASTIPGPDAPNPNTPPSWPTGLVNGNYVFLFIQVYDSATPAQTPNTFDGVSPDVGPWKTVYLSGNYGSSSRYRHYVYAKLVTEGADPGGSVPPPRQQFLVSLDMRE